MGYIPTRLTASNSMAGFRRELKKILKCIVVSIATKMTCEDINEDFIELEGRPIPYSILSFSSLKEYIESLWDTFRVDPETGLVSLAEMPGINKSAHVRRMVENEVDPNNYRDRFVRGYASTKKLPPWTIMDVINQDPVINFYQQMDIVVLVNRHKGVMSLDQFLTDVKTVLEVQSLERAYGSVERLLEKLHHLIDVIGDKIYMDLSNYSADVKDLGLNPYYVPNVPIIPDSIIDAVKKLLADESHGIWAHELQERYEEVYGYPLDYWTFGFPTVTQFLGTLPHIFRLRRFDGFFRLYDMRHSDPAAPGVPKRDIQNVLSLLARFSDGIDVDYFDALYYVMYRSTFSYEAMGFPDSVYALNSLNAEHRIVLERIGETLIVRLKTKTMARVIRSVLPFLNIKFADSMPKEWYPESVLRPGDKVVSNRCLERVMKTEGGFNIELLAIYSPALFFATLQNGYSKQLEEELNAFYKDCAPSMRMPSIAAVPGVFSVTVFKEKYERVLITGEGFAPDHVEVLMIDKGYFEHVRQDSLYFLSKKFQFIPNQAFLCYMPCMLPNNDSYLFSAESNDMFKSLVKDKTLLAKVYEFKTTTMEAALVPIDVTDGDYIDIRKVMLSLYLGFVSYKNPICPLRHYATWALYARLVF